MIENRFVTSESGFVVPEWWAACEQADLRPVVADRALPVWVGLDASVKRDQTAIVVVTWRDDVHRVRLVWHRTFQPSPSDPLDFEATIGETVRALGRRFDVRAVRYDPYQMASMAQRLIAAGLPMVEFPQTVANLTEASSCLYDLIKGRNLEVYADDELRLAIHRAIALETARGWRIAKEKAAHTIDVVVALAQACLAAVKGSVEPHAGFLAWMRHFDRNAVPLHDHRCPTCYPPAGAEGAPVVTITLPEDRRATSRTCPGCASVFGAADFAGLTSCPQCGQLLNRTLPAAIPRPGHLPALLGPPSSVADGPGAACPQCGSPLWRQAQLTSFGASYECRACGYAELAGPPGAGCGVHP